LIKIEEIAANIFIGIIGMLLALSIRNIDCSDAFIELLFLWIIEYN